MSFNKEVTRDAVKKINSIMEDMFGRSSGKTKHLYNPWNPPKDWEGTVYLFAYTPWKTTFKGKEGFYALKYRLLKNGKRKLVKAVRFGRRKIAKARSIKWYNGYYRKEK